MIKGITKEELANLLLVTLLQVEEYISGKYNFDLKTMVKLQRDLGEPIIEISNQDKAVDQFECPSKRYESIVPNQSMYAGEGVDKVNIKVNEMKFNLEKLKAIARPMSSEALAALDYPADNADWLCLSAIIALKIRQILRLKNISKEELANLLSVSLKQVEEYLSGKYNLDLKTIAKIQKVLDVPIIEVDLSCKSLEGDKVEKNNEESNNEEIEQLQSNEFPVCEEQDSQLDKYRDILYEGYLHD